VVGRLEYRPDEAMGVTQTMQIGDPVGENELVIDTLTWSINGQPRATDTLRFTTHGVYEVTVNVTRTTGVTTTISKVVEAHDYYPFGLLMPGRDYQSGSETKEKFTGKERDSETDLDYFGARYYWAAGGRWWSLDPLENTFTKWNPYNYVFNLPIIYVDPMGFSPATRDLQSGLQADWDAVYGPSNNSLPGWSTWQGTSKDYLENYRNELGGHWEKNIMELAVVEKQQVELILNLFLIGKDIFGSG